MQDKLAIRHYILHTASMLSHTTCPWSTMPWRKYMFPIGGIRLSSGRFGPLVFADSMQTVCILWLQASLHLILLQPNMLLNPFKSRYLVICLNIGLNRKQFPKPLEPRYWQIQNLLSIQSNSEIRLTFWHYKPQEPTLRATLEQTLEHLRIVISNSCIKEWRRCHPQVILKLP